jgi:hypothetical protein
LATIKFFLLIQKVTLEISRLADTTHRQLAQLSSSFLLGDPKGLSSGSQRTGVIKQLLTSFQFASTRVSVYRDVFVESAQEANDCPVLLGRPPVITSLMTIHTELNKTLQLLKASLSSFRQNSLHIREAGYQKLQIASMEGLPTTSEHYTKVIKAEWETRQFDMHPNFKQRTMDHSTVLIDVDTFLELGKRWIHPVIGTGPIEKTIQDAEMRVQTIASSFPIPEVLSQMVQIGLRTDISSQWEQTFKAIQRSSRKDPLRIGFFGCVNSGKSSTINSLVGRVLLRSNGKA